MSHLAGSPAGREGAIGPLDGGGAGAIPALATVNLTAHLARGDPGREARWREAARLEGIDNDEDYAAGRHRLELSPRHAAPIIFPDLRAKQQKSLRQQNYFALRNLLRLQEWTGRGSMVPVCFLLWSSTAKIENWTAYAREAEDQALRIANAARDALTCMHRTCGSKTHGGGAAHHHHEAHSLHHTEHYDRPHHWQDRHWRDENWDDISWRGGWWQQGEKRVTHLDDKTDRVETHTSEETDRKETQVELIEDSSWEHQRKTAAGKIAASEAKRIIGTASRISELVREAAETKEDLANFRETGLIVKSSNEARRRRRVSFSSEQEEQGVMELERRRLKEERDNEAELNDVLWERVCFVLKRKAFTAWFFLWSLEFAIDRFCARRDAEILLNMFALWGDKAAGRRQELKREVLLEGMAIRLYAEYMRSVIADLFRSWWMGRHKLRHDSVVAVKEKVRTSITVYEVTKTSKDFPRGIPVVMLFAAGITMELVLLSCVHSWHLEASRADKERAQTTSQATWKNLHQSKLNQLVGKLIGLEDRLWVWRPCWHAWLLEVTVNKAMNDEMKAEHSTELLKEKYRRFHVKKIDELVQTILGLKETVPYFYSWLADVLKTKTENAITEYTKQQSNFSANFRKARADALEEYMRRVEGLEDRLWLVLPCVDAWRLHVYRTMQDAATHHGQELDRMKDDFKEKSKVIRLEALEKLLVKMTGKRVVDTHWAAWHWYFEQRKSLVALAKANKETEAEHAHVAEELAHIREQGKRIRELLKDVDHQMVGARLARLHEMVALNEVWSVWMAQHLIIKERVDADPVLARHKVIFERRCKHWSMGMSLGGEAYRILKHQVSNRLAMNFRREHRPWLNGEFAGWAEYIRFRRLDKVALEHLRSEKFEYIARRDGLLMKKEKSLPRAQRTFAVQARLKPAGGNTPRGRDKGSGLLHMKVRYASDEEMKVDLSSARQADRGGHARVRPRRATSQEACDDDAWKAFVEGGIEALAEIHKGRPYRRGDLGYKILEKVVVDHQMKHKVDASESYIPILDSEEDVDLPDFLFAGHDPDVDHHHILAEDLALDTVVPRPPGVVDDEDTGGQLQGKDVQFGKGRKGGDIMGGWHGDGDVGGAYGGQPKGKQGNRASVEKGKSSKGDTKAGQNKANITWSGEETFQTIGWEADSWGDHQGGRRIKLKATELEMSQLSSHLLKAVDDLRLRICFKRVGRTWFRQCERVLEDRLYEGIAAQRRKREVALRKELEADREGLRAKRRQSIRDERGRLRPQVDDDLERRVAELYRILTERPVLQRVAGTWFRMWTENQEVARQRQAAFYAQRVKYLEQINKDEELGKQRRRELEEMRLKELQDKEALEEEERFKRLQVNMLEVARRVRTSVANEYFRWCFQVWSRFEGGGLTALQLRRENYRNELSERVHLLELNSLQLVCCVRVWRRATKLEKAESSRDQMVVSRSNAVSKALFELSRADDFYLLQFSLAAWTGLTWKPRVVSPRSHRLADVSSRSDAGNGIQKANEAARTFDEDTVLYDEISTLRWNIQVNKHRLETAVRHAGIITARASAMVYRSRARMLRAECFREWRRTRRRGDPLQAQPLQPRSPRIQESPTRSQTSQRSESSPSPFVRTTTIRSARAPARPQSLMSTIDEVNPSEPASNQATSSSVAPSPKTPPPLQAQPSPQSTSVEARLNTDELRRPAPTPKSTPPSNTQTSRIPSPRSHARVAHHQDILGDILEMEADELPPSPVPQFRRPQGDSL